MKIDTLNLFFKDALKNIKRNTTISIISISTIIITLFTLGLFLLLLLNVKVSISEINTVKKATDVNINQNISEELYQIVKTVGQVGLPLFLIFTAVTILLISNTIKLAAYSRREEISIMKYIGATDWFIRWPFIFDGMIIGFLGSLESIIAIYFLYSFAYKKATPYPGSLFISLIKPSFVLTTMSWIFILIGTIISALISMWSIRKFLAV